jgi:hypothetical protein
VEFEPSIAVLDRAKTVRALDRIEQCGATVIRAPSFEIHTLTDSGSASCRERACASMERWRLQFTSAPVRARMCLYSVCLCASLLCARVAMSLLCESL